MKFPVHAFPKPVREYLTSKADALDCSPGMIGLPFICGTGAAIGNRRVIELVPGSSENSTVPVFWGMPVAGSGEDKSRAIRAGMLPVARLDSEIRSASQLEFEQWQDRASQLRKAKNDPPPKPPERLLIFTESSRQNLIDKLIDNPTGIIAQWDELHGLFARFNEHGGEGERDQYNTTWNGNGRLSYSTRGQRKETGKSEIIADNAALSIVGGIQPGPLFAAMAKNHNRESGLLARFLVCQNRRQRSFDLAAVKPVPDSIVNGCCAIVRRVAFNSSGLNPERYGDGYPDRFWFDDTAQTMFAEWYRQHGEFMQDLATRLRFGDPDDGGDTISPGFVEALAKLHIYGGRFVLLCHLLDQTSGRDGINSNPELIAPVSVKNGLRLVEYFAEQSRQVFNRRSAGDEQTARVLDLLERRGEPLSARDIQRALSRHFADSTETERKLWQIENDGQIQSARRTADNGRNVRVFYIGADVDAVFSGTNGQSVNNSDGDHQAMR